MYQTGHPWSGYHTAARCISGGPVLITDIPGKHDTELVEQMTATSLNGTFIALRPKPAAVLDHWDGYAQGNICKIGTSVGEEEQTVGIVGLFNIIEGTVSELIPITAFPAMSTEDSPEVIVKSHRTGQIFGPLERDEKSLLSVTLAPRGYDILTAYPIQYGGVAVLGLQGKMTGAAAILRQSMDGKAMTVSLKALGTLEVWLADSMNRRVKAMRAKGKALSDSHVATRTLTTGKIFEIDLLSFWQQNRLWCEDTEVNVQIELQAV
jgi:hypothetical protein